MRKILITGGTTFVSRWAAEYFVRQGDDVYVLNRGTREQSPSVTLIQGDRNELGGKLKAYSFDAVLDVTAYTRAHVESLLDALGSFGEYILVSSSAVYPETNPQPFHEAQECHGNTIWGAYSYNKLEAEQYLQKRVPKAYILRPPYIYGPMQSLYREPFVFDCAIEDRPFYLPGAGDLKLQFLYIEDLCRFMDLLLKLRPKERIYNVGDKEAVTVRHWVELCYAAAGKKPEFREVPAEIPQREYFPFHPYEYYLDVSLQEALMPKTTPLALGLCESFAWYEKRGDAVPKRPYMGYIEKHM